MSGANRILVRRNDRNFGPYSVAELNALLVSGRVLEDDLAWIEGDPDWQTVRTIPGVRRLPPLPKSGPTAPARRDPNESDRLILPAFLLAFFLGPFGAHRFYCGHTGSGVVMLVLTITVVGLFATVIWATIDWIMIVCGSFRDERGRPITQWT